MLQIKKLNLTHKKDLVGAALQDRPTRDGGHLRGLRIRRRGCGGVAANHGPALPLACFLPGEQAHD